jgi:hypothetical protein
MCIMADVNSHPNSDAARIEVAASAAGQIEALIDSLGREMLRDGSFFPESLEPIFFALMGRMKALNSVVLSVTQGDVGREARQMHRVVFEGFAIDTQTKGLIQYNAAEV